MDCDSITTSKNVILIENDKEGDTEPVDNNDDSDASLEFVADDDDDFFEFDFQPLGKDEEKEETNQEKSARQEKEKMELYWKLMDVGFSRDRASEAVFEKSYTDISAATEYLLTTGIPDAFALENNAPTDHKYYNTKFIAFHAPNFNKAITKEYNLLRSSLPEGIYVRGFENRTDLYSVMIKGPKGTPYEDALFFFDIQLSADYPRTAPKVHFIHYAGQSHKKLNPNLYVNGMVCLSILGTWSGTGCENWDPNNSNLFQVLVSIQGLVLVSEPYYNEPGFERSRGTKNGTSESRKYNQSTIIEVLKSVIEQAQHPPYLFEENVRQHYLDTSQQFLRRLESWFEINMERNKGNANVDRAATEHDPLNLRKNGEMANSLTEGINTHVSHDGIQTNKSRAVGEKSLHKKMVVKSEKDKNTSTEDQKNGDKVVKHKSVLDAISNFPPPEFPLLPVPEVFQSQVTELMAKFENAVKTQKYNINITTKIQ